MLQEEEEEEENRLAEMAERRFEEQQSSKQDDPRPATVEQPEASGASFVNISFDMEPEPPLNPPDTNRVPSPLPSWKLTLTDKPLTFYTSLSVGKTLIYLAV